MSPSFGKNGSERGSAIVFVLWISVLLALLLAGASALVQTELRLAGNRRDVLQRDASLMSALDLVAFDTALVGRSYISSLPRSVQINDESVTVRLAPSHQKLDINMANDEDWIALFTYLGESEGASLRLADQILDWRDNDTNRRDQGAEAEDYPAGGDKTPANRAFISVGELIQVRDMTRQRLSCLSPYVTVFGGTPDPVLTLIGDDQSNSMEGVRVSFLAEQEREGGHIDRLTGLALFGSNSRRPFEWVGFVEEENALSGCLNDTETAQVQTP